MVNYMAILVAALASMVIGMVWYGPLFRKQWMKLAGITPQSMKRMKLSPKAAMSMGFVASLVTAYVLSVFVGGVMAWTAAANFVFWIWLGFVAPVQLGAFLWEGKDFKLFILNTSYSLITLVVMAGILAVWP